MWGIRYLESAHTYGKEEAALAVSTLFLGWGLAAPFAGWISDKLRRRVMPMMIGAFLAAIVMTVLLYTPHLSRAAVFTLLFVLGMCYSVQVIVFAYACEVSPKRSSGSAIAVTNMLVMLGGVIFQPAVGILLDLKWTNNPASAAGVFSNTDFKYALAVIPIALIVAAVIPIFQKETYCKQVNTS